MTQRIRSSLFALWALAPLAWPAHATNNATAIESLATIRGAAEQFVLSRLPPTQAKYYVDAAALDSRLRLAQCPAPLETFAAAANAVMSARTTVGVRCQSASPWTIYVPVAIEVEASVLVLRRGLARRSPIQAEDVELQVRRLPGTSSAFINDVVALQGHRLKRAVPAGTPLTIELLAPDLLIRRGQKVTLVASTGSMEIRAEGLALGDGGASDRIRVQNSNSMKIVEGVVVNAGTVRVDL